MNEERTRHRTPSLRLYRLLAGKTQREVGEEAGVSHGFVGGLETGRLDARPSTIAALALAVYVEISDLLKEPSAVAQAPPGATEPAAGADALPKVGQRVVQTVCGHATAGVVEERTTCAFTGLTYFRILADEFPYPLVGSSLTVRGEAA